MSSKKRKENKRRVCFHSSFIAHLLICSHYPNPRIEVKIKGRKKAQTVSCRDRSYSHENIPHSKGNILILHWCRGASFMKRWTLFAVSRFNGQKNIFLITGMSCTTLFFLLLSQQWSVVKFCSAHGVTEFPCTAWPTSPAEMQHVRWAWAFCGNASPFHTWHITALILS